MVRFLSHWFTVAVALGVTAWILPGVHVDGIPALLVAALVLGFVNAIVKPILVILTLPITIVTLGLFYFVVSGLTLELTAWLVPGFRVDSIWWAIAGAIVVSLVSSFIGWFTREDARVS